VAAILLIGFFGFVSVLYGAEDANDVRAAGVENPAGEETPAQQKASRANVPADVEAVVGPNEPNAVPGPNDVNEIIRKQFGPLESIWRRLDVSGQKELNVWMEQSIEKRTNIVKVVNEQIIAELGFVRQLAVQEKASKTVIAVDRLLNSRKLRVESVLKQLDEASARKTRIEELREKREREQEERRRDAEERRRERERDRQRR
jgi:hypothetical protein